MHIRFHQAPEDEGAPGVRLSGDLFPLNVVCARRVSRVRQCIVVVEWPSLFRFEHVLVDSCLIVMIIFSSDS